MASADFPKYNKEDTEELVIAINSKDNKRVDAVLTRNPDINYQPYSEELGAGYSPLMDAVSRNYLYGVQALLDQKDINVNAVNRRRATALMLACSAHDSKFNPLIVHALLNKDGINLSLTSGMGKTAWMYLTEKGNHRPEIDVRFPRETRVEFSEGGGRRNRKRSRKQRRTKRRSIRRN
jgi:ankyrin repeat protein